MVHRKNTVTDLEVQTKHYWRVMQVSLRHFRADSRDRDRDPFAYDELDLLSQMTDSPRIRRLSKQAVVLCLCLSNAA
jgi:hypothetical protein